MNNTDQYSDEELFEFWCSSKDGAWAVKCLTEHNRRRLEKKMGFPIFVGGKYKIHDRMSSLPGKAAAGIWINNDDDQCDNGTIPIGEEIVLIENLLWAEDFLYAMWNGRKVAISAYHIEPI